MQVLSDHGGQQLGHTVQQLQDAGTNLAAWHDSYLQAQQSLASSRRAKSWWKRLLGVSTGTEREAPVHVRHAWQGVAAIHRDHQFHNKRRGSAGGQRNRRG